MHYLRVNTVETERPRGAAGASIDCDRLEETCTPLLSVRGFSQCPCKSTLTAPPLESSRSAIKQSSLAQIARGNPTAGPSAIHRSFITRARVTKTRRQNDMRWGGTGAELSRGASHSCRWGGKTLSGFIWVQCVSCSAQLQIETSELGEGEER